MAHWTDSPRIHNLMTYLGKTGKTGRPTRAAHVAEQVSKIMISIEPRVTELRLIRGEHDKLVAHWEKLKDLIEHKKRHADGIKIEFEQASNDLLSQNPDADISAFNKDLRSALEDLENDFQKAIAEVDGVKQSIRVKRTTVRSLEDRLESYHKQVNRHMKQLIKPQQQKSA